MPRRAPLTQRQIEDRQKFGFGPRKAIPRRPDGAPEQKVRSYNFGNAFYWLGEMDAKTRGARERELNTIVCAHKLALCVEKQETPAAKAEALQRAPRLYPHRQRALACIQATRLDKDPVAQRRRSEAMCVLKDKRWLPQSLEQEVARLQLSSGRSFEECCKELETWYRSKSRWGRNETNALRNTMHALQALACGVNKKLTWQRGKNISPDLIGFLTDVLDAAKIECPSYEDSPAKFRRLLIGHRVRGQRALAQKCSFGGTPP
jgi:hypothetical protein